jgi:aspartyl-tRNA synthetase
MSQNLSNQPNIRILSSEVSQKSNDTVVLKGWVDTVRDHGKLVFIDLRDRDGYVQVVVDQSNAALYEIAKSLNSEDCIELTGTVVPRAESMVNKNIVSGTVEVQAKDILIYSRSKLLPFDVSRDSNGEIDEALRLKYRYLDLRRTEMRDHMKLRHDIIKYIRDYMSEKTFWEIETPILMKGTPEGSREYIVPSRLNQGKFYVLPQFKQLLMVSGMEKYFQIARCFRDEDQRGDRQPEFTQLDIEMSFPSQEEILNLIEKMLIEITENFMPDKKMRDVPFTRITNAEAMEKYGNDKPDLRIGMEISNYTEGFKKVTSDFIQKILSNNGVVKGILSKDAQWFTRKGFDTLNEYMKQNGAGGLLYIKFEETGFTSPISKFISEDAISEIKKTADAKSGDVLFLIAEKNEKALELLNVLRKEIAKTTGLYEKVKDELAYLWVTDFPLFEWDETNKKISAVHHPFTSPRIEDIPLMTSEPLKVLSQAYDIVLNGYELGGGSIRIHDRELQKKLFRVLEISDEDMTKRFGHILEAFEYGVPPHGGIALGIERLLMVFTETESIREVMAFPKNQTAKDLMTSAPAEVSEEQLRELGIKLI